MEFSFALHYLSGRAYAKSYSEQERPEYPPHPARFFSALVASLYASELGEEARAALLWLEGLDAPRIAADGCWERSHVTTYVPTNEEAHDAVPSLRTAKKQPRSFPSVTLKSPTVHFIYSLNDEHQRGEFKKHESALRQLASNVTYVGHSASLVSVSLSTDPSPPPTFGPSEDGDVLLRVVTDGRLQELEQAYNLGLRPPTAMAKSYSQTVEATPVPTIVEGVFKDFVPFRLRATLPFKVAIKVSNAVRAEIARLLETRATQLIWGREHYPHCAFVALPDVAFEHSDGHLLGFAALLPKAFGDEDRRALFRALSKLDGGTLDLGAVGQFPVEWANEDTKTLGLQERTWCRASKIWESVTPVLFDRYPKNGKNGENAGDIIAHSCAHVGLRVPLDLVSVGKFSLFKGVPPADSRFFQLGDQPYRYAAHVTIGFKQKVKGPMVLGAGRHYGLGLMRPKSENGAEE
jgi:CRISPR-associated protein Csb2